MKRFISSAGMTAIVLSLLAFAWLKDLAAQGKERVKTEVAGLRIVKKPYKGAQSLRAFNWFAGTTVSILLVSDQPGLINLDVKKSSLTRFADDKGTDLLKKPKFGGFFGSFPKLSEDRKACVLEIKSSELPSKGAKTILVKGSAALTYATGKITKKTEKIGVAQGSSFQVGDLKFKLTKVGKPQWGRDYQMAVTLETNQDIKSVAAYRFLDSKGKEIKSHRSTWMSSFGKSSLTFNLKRKVAVFTMELDMWQGMKSVSVPFELSVSVGL